MEIINSDINRQELVISHLNDSSNWKLAEFDRSKFDGRTDLFHYNNKYLEKLSPQEQNRLFAIYKEIRHIFDTGLPTNVLHNRLVPLVKELLDSHDLNKVESWIRLHTDIQYPDLDLDYTQSLSSNKTREQTYLKDDYVRLICMIFILRLMVPIWSEFISMTKKETGNHFKEYTALQLITGADITHSEPMSKLITYVKLAIPEDSLTSGVLVFLSAEDFPIWMLSVILVKMLCVTDIKGNILVDESGTRTVQNIVPFIYNNIKEKIKRAEISFGKIKDKNPESSSSDNESSSNVETYKIKQELPSGDVVMLEYAMSNIANVVLKLEPNINIDLLFNALETSESLYKARIYEQQITLLQWIYKPVLPPKAIPLLTKRTVVNALAGAQAILWHRGHYELAGLVTATVANDNDTGEHYTSGVESRSKVTKETLEELNKLFPYGKKDHSKLKSKVVNQAIAAIDKLDEKLKRNWLLTIDNREKITSPSMLQLLTGSTINRRYSIPHNIKNKIAALIIDLAKRPRNI
jgi:hypothetical protein